MLRPNSTQPFPLHRSVKPDCSQLESVAHQSITVASLCSAPRPRQLPMNVNLIYATSTKPTTDALTISAFRSEYLDLPNSHELIHEFHDLLRFEAGETTLHLHPSLVTLPKFQNDLLIH